LGGYKAMENFLFFSLILFTLIAIFVGIFYTKRSPIDKVLAIIAFVWLMWSNKILNLSGHKWLLAMAPAFGIFIYLKYKETKEKYNKSE
jgi:hypothetical protein